MAANFQQTQRGPVQKQASAYEISKKKKAIFSSTGMAPAQPYVLKPKIYHTTLLVLMSRFPVYRSLTIPPSTKAVRRRQFSKKKKNNYKTMLGTFYIRLHDRRRDTTLVTKAFFYIMVLSYPNERDFFLKICFQLHRVIARAQVKFPKFAYIYLFAGGHSSSRSSNSSYSGYDITRF